MKRFRAAALAIAAATAGAANAATPDQAALARACSIPEETVAASEALEPALKRFDADIAHEVKGAIAPDAIRIIEFFDYSCPSCMALHPVFERYLADNRDVRLNLVEYPIYGRTLVSRVTGNKTLTATHVALAARDQGKYMAFHNALFSRGGRPDMKKIKWAAGRAGLDYDAALARAAADDIQALAEENLAYAETLGIIGTPGLVVEGIILSVGPWSLENVGCLVQAARAAKAK
ncbi:MAG: DsbA family protein [Parvularculaceae bacterium]